jgi:uncharacterized membrane protein required for colicin V production
MSKAIISGFWVGFWQAAGFFFGCIGRGFLIIEFGCKTLANYGVTEERE